VSNDSGGGSSSSDTEPPAPWATALATASPRLFPCSPRLPPAVHDPPPPIPRPSYPISLLKSSGSNRTFISRQRPTTPSDLHRRLLVTFPPRPTALVIRRPVGQGHYAKVFEALEDSGPGAERRVCAVKQIPATHEWTALEALRLQQAQAVPNVVECRACYYDAPRRSIWVVMERMEGSLLDILQAGQPFPEAMIADVARQTLRALRGLHTLHYAHLDVKPGNILYRRLQGEGMEYKLSDFGCMQDERDQETDELGEYTYMAPEVALRKARTTRTDIWNLGITLLHLADREPPLNGWDDKLRVELIARTTLCPQLREPERWSPELADFIAKCLVKNHRLRPDAATLLRHPLFLTNPAPRS